MNKAETVTDTAVLELPYAPIPERPSRDILRTHTRDEKIKRGKESYFVHVNDIEIRDGFNARMNIEGLSEEEYREKRLMISESAAQLLASGYPPPALKGDFTKEGKFIPTEGHRRTYMILWLLEQGHTTWPATGDAIEMVEVELLPREFTELDRAKMVIHSQNNLKLTPLEYGYHFLRLNKVFKVSHEDIAKEFNGQRSRQWVTNMIALTGLPKEVQVQIQLGNLTPTAALALKTNVKDEEQLNKMVKDSAESGDKISVKDAQALKTAEPVAFNASDISLKMYAVIEQYRDGIINFEKASADITAISDKAVEEYPDKVSIIHDFAVVSMETLRKSPGEDTDNNGPEPEPEVEEISPSIRYERDEADDIEADSHKTSAKAPTVAPKSQKDVLPPVDFSHEKEEGIMDLTEAIKLTDKITVRLKHTPMPDQHRNDLEQMLGWIAKKCETAKEILTKAADQR